MSFELNKVLKIKKPISNIHKMIILIGNVVSKITNESFKYSSLKNTFINSTGINRNTANITILAAKIHLVQVLYKETNISFLFCE